MQRARIFSSLDGSGSCSTSLACVWVRLVCWGSVVVGVLVLFLGSMLLAVFLRSVTRCSCLVSDFVTGGFSLVFISLVCGWVIGHIVWARRWYPSMASTTSFAAMSIWSVVTWSESRSCWMVSIKASCWAIRLVSLPSW